MTYIELINQFWYIDEDWQFTCCETRLYFYLLKTANRLGWVDSWTRSDAKVSSDVGVSVNSMKTARNRLVQAGLIEVKIGGKGQRDKTKYLIRYQNLIPKPQPNLIPKLEPNLEPNLEPKPQPKSIYKERAIDKDKDIDIEKETSANADAKKVAAAKSWRDDFEVYKSELKEAFDKILSDKDFVENRQKYHPNLDIRLSLQKSYEDYWATEAGWKKKKSSKAKEIDWPATFRKALDQPQNRVYKQNCVSKPEPERAMSELQERFARFLRKEAPLLLDMPLQPSDEEVGVLLKIRKEILLDIVKKINNDKYLTTRKNSVFQTIMELKQKEYGTT